MWRTLRVSSYLIGFFALFHFVDEDKAAVLLAVYKYVMSIRDAFDKLYSWHVQLGSIVAHGSWKIARVAISVWWTLSNKKGNFEKAARTIETAVSRVTQEEEETGGRYHTFKTATSQSA